MAEIDTSAGAVFDLVVILRRVAKTSNWNTESADLLEALLAQRDAAVARAEEAEGERDEAKQTLSTVNKQFYASVDDLATINALRRTALARVAELEGEVRHWRGRAREAIAEMGGLDSDPDFATPPRKET